MAHDAPWEHHHEVGDPLAGLDDAVVWTTVGLDVGSATSQVVFSRVVLVRDDARYVVVERRILHESEVILTPYRSPERIDGERLGAFIAGEYVRAGVAPDQVDTGAVILTGLALATDNARAIADAVADTSGRFVAVSAGDILEAKLAAHGAGVPSIEVDGVLVHVDIGGGTTKLSAWRGGRLLGLAAMDVGARLVTFDEAGRIEHVEGAARRLAASLGVRLPGGETPDPDDVTKLGAAMAAEIMAQAGLSGAAPAAPELLRTAPLFGSGHETPAAVVFTGGVSEYVYGRETRRFGDLGPAIGEAVAAAVARSGVPLTPFERGIRATVLGVSQHSVQLSGNTVFVSDERALPIRNAPVLAPWLNLETVELDADEVAHEIAHALAHEGLGPERRMLAVAIAWEGSATYARLKAVARGIAAGLAPVLRDEDPALVIVDGDVAGALGWHLREQFGASRPVVCLDSVDVHEFDHVDVGAFAANTRALPVVVKSLLFAGDPGRGRAERHHHHHHHDDHDHHHHHHHHEEHP